MYIEPVLVDYYHRKFDLINILIISAKIKLIRKRSAPKIINNTLIWFSAISINRLTWLLLIYCAYSKQIKRGNSRLIFNSMYGKKRYKTCPNLLMVHTINAYESLMLSRQPGAGSSSNFGIHGILAASEYPLGPLGKLAGASPTIGNRGLLSSFRCV